jgi:glycosyltransferase involved in cell wall biosynthesis
MPTRLFGAWKRKRAIGIVSPAYGSEKVSYGLLPRGYAFHKLYRIPFQRIERKGTFWKYTPVLLDHPVELVHTFNELPLGMRPFVVSFENELPRYLGRVHSWQRDAGYRLLASSRCRHILALSEIAAQTLRRDLAANGMSETAGKVSVFRGAVLSAPTFENRIVVAAATPLRVLFVGRDPFGKGLLPLLDALADCRAQGAAIQATIVCNFEARDYISKGRNPDTAALLALLQHDPNITHHHLVPNGEIHRLMQTHDVFLFPTLDESLGWVAVEAAMAGMPVIATDIYAIPELVVDGATGFLISLHKNEASRWAGLWMDGSEFDRETESTFAVIREGLTRHILRFAEDPSLVSAMGESIWKSCIRSMLPVADWRKRMRAHWTDDGGSMILGDAA